MPLDVERASLVASLRELVGAEGVLIGNRRRLPLRARAEAVDALQRIFPGEVILPLSDGADEAIVVELGAGDRPSEEDAKLGFFHDLYPAILTRTFTPGKQVAERASVGAPGLVLMHTPRTGSHYLQSLIASFPGFSATEEWIRPPVIHAIGLGIVSLRAHLENCISLQLAGCDRWSFTLDYRSLREQWSKLCESDRQAFINLLRRAHCVRLTRQDYIAQAWSEIKAVSTGSFFRMQAHGDPQPGPDIYEHPERFYLWASLILAQNEEADRWCEEELTGTAATIAYEGILTDLDLREQTPRILGPFWRDGIYLKTATSQYLKQTTSEDHQAIDSLRHHLTSQKKLLLSEVRVSGGIPRGERVVLSRGSLFIPGLFANGMLRIDFAVSGRAAWALSLRLFGRGQYCFLPEEPGLYVLLVRAVPSPLSLRVEPVESSASAPFELRQLAWTPWVELDQRYPWLHPLHRDDTILLARCE